MNFELDLIFKYSNSVGKKKKKERSWKDSTLGFDRAIYVWAIRLLKQAQHIRCLFYEKKGGYKDLGYFYLFPSFKITSQDSFAQLSLLDIQTLFYHK